MINTYLCPSLTPAGSNNRHGCCCILYKKPPPYVKLIDGSIRVRKKMLGGWETAEIKNLEVVEVRGSNLYMAFGEGKGKELQINLNAMNYTDARELHELINNLA